MDAGLASHPGLPPVRPLESFVARWGQALARVAVIGVYAVRAGPALTRNLQHALAGLAIEAYRPQRRSLYLLATGPQEAIESWGPLSAAGRSAWRWKDWITGVS